MTYRKWCLLLVCYLYFSSLSFPNGTYSISTLMVIIIVSLFRSGATNISLIYSGTALERNKFDPFLIIPSNMTDPSPFKIHNSINCIDFPYLIFDFIGRVNSDITHSIVSLQPRRCSETV